MAYRTSSEHIITELHKIQRNNGGKLYPEAVVKAAESKTSPLHKHFTWSDSKAAHKCRLMEARELISASVRYVQLNGDKRPVRVFVSLRADRPKGGGYYDAVMVLGNNNLRQQLLQDAHEDLRRFELKYAGLKELSEVFVASKKIRNRLQALWAA